MVFLSNFEYMTCMTQRSVFRIFFVAVPTPSYDAVLKVFVLTISDDFQC